MQIGEGRSVYVGKCIYCGSTEQLSDEHAIPFALKGNRVVRAGSCFTCNKVTTRFERSILRNSMLAIRTVLGLPTRQKKNRPATLPHIFIRGEERSEEQVPISDSIPAFVLPELGPPKIYPEVPHVSNLPPGAFLPKIFFPVDRSSDQHREKLLKKYSADAVELPWEIDHEDFRRMMAKIAMCEAICMYGFHRFRTIYVTKAVLGQEPADLFVGGDGDLTIHRNGGFDNSSHIVAAMRPIGQDEVWIRIKLWNKSVTQEYIVVVGRLQGGYARFLDAHGSIV